MKLKLRHSQIVDLCQKLGERIIQEGDLPREPVRVYGVPRGGVAVAYLLTALFPTTFCLAESAADGDVFVDDIIDSGETALDFKRQYPNRPFFAMIDKLSNSGSAFKDSWIVFPWEQNEEEANGIESNIRRLLQFVGEDPKRGGLLETPGRVARAWEHWTSGYKKDPASILKVFEDGADGCDEMVVVKDIPFYSQCEHHLAPFFGTATVAYIPDGKIVGLSKISRVVDLFARRLQVQERLTNQIADALDHHLHPKGVGVIINARHLCMESRGICQQGHSTITSALRGVLRDKPEARAEFMALSRSI